MYRQNTTSEQPNFSFLQNCLFCGELCVITKDPKHPGRWRPAYVCKEGERFGNKGLKEAILETCDKRKDIQSEHIRVRMAGFLTDLHAGADVRYHVDCKATFLSSKSIQAAIYHQSIRTELKDAAFDSLVKYLDENKANIHSSIDIYTKYMEEGGHVFSRRQLVQQIVEKFGGDMITLSSPGIASMLAFKSGVAKVFHLPDDTDDMSEAIKKVAKTIKAELDSIETDRNYYHSHIDKDVCSKFQSNTLDDVLSKVSQKLKQSLPALLIGNIITSVVKNLATPLQLALAVLMKDSKEHVKAFFDFGVTCSYDELLRFKKSVAITANANMISLD